MGGVRWWHKYATHPKNCEKKELACNSCGAGGAFSLLVGSDCCWLRFTQPAASKTLSMAPQIPFYLI